MRDEKDPSDELEAKPLTREALHEFLAQLRARVEADAQNGAAARDAQRAAEQKERDDRITELRRQVDELQKE